MKTRALYNADCPSVIRNGHYDAYAKARIYPLKLWI